MPRYVDGDLRTPVGTRVRFHRLHSPSIPYMSHALGQTGRISSVGIDSYSVTFDNGSYGDAFYADELVYEVCPGVLEARARANLRH